MGTSQRRTWTSQQISWLLIGGLAPACTVSVEPGAVVIDLPGSGGSAGQSGGGAGEAGSAGSGGEAGEGQLPDGGLPGSDCSVSFVTPSPAAVPLTLGPGDDRDGTACGNTFATDVVVASSGASVTLFVDGAPWAAQLVSGASSSFEGVLLGTRAPAVSTLRAVATMSDGRTCEATLGSLAVDCEGPSCTLTGPSSNAALSDADDADPAAPGLQASFSLRTDPDNTGTEAHLILNGDSGAALSSTFASDTLTFANVTLAEGPARTVQGECRDSSGNVTRSAIATWSVALAACQVEIVSPAPGDDPLTLGPAEDQDDDACGTDFTTSVDVETNAASLALLVDGQPVSTLGVSSASAHFAGVVLGTRTPATSAISVQATMADGRTCVATRDNLVVDCEGPSCSLVATSNNPFFNLANDEDPSSPGLQTSFRVDSDADNLDRDARLIVDDDESTALTSVFDASDGGASASFAPVTLAEGPVRTVRAECEDDLGNVTRSATLSWAVDLTPCTIEIDSVAADADPITRALDQAPLSTGIQVNVVGRVTGSACTGVRVGVCGQPLGAFAGSAIVDGDWTLPVTLADVTGPGEVCAQVQDDAQNLVEARVPVNVRSDNPIVAIASPADGAQINLLGTNGAIADLTPSSTSCELAVQVDCTDVGSAVVLSVDGAALPQQAICLANANVAAPFQGRASFDSVSLSASAASHTLSAQQSVAGLVGSSTAITLSSDCAAPVLAFAQPLCGGQLHLINDDTQPGTAGLQHDVVVDNGGVATVSLSVARSGGSQSLTVTGDQNSTSFASVNLGTPGDVTLTANAIDAAGNLGTASCQLTVVVEPTVNLLAPTAQQVLTTTNDCAPAGGGFGINVSGTTSADPGSSVQVAIGAAAPVNLATVVAGSGGLNTFSGCVAIPEGVNQTINVTVTDDPNPPGNNTVLVSVDTRAPTDPVLAPLAAITNRRAGRVTFSWDHVEDADGSPLAGYDLHCAASPITDEASWSAARALTVSTPGAALGSPQASELIPSPSCTGNACRSFRPGTTEFCVMRGRDIAGALTPLDGSNGNVAVSVPFVTTPFTSVLNGNSSFTNVVGLGDVNGDGFEDMLYGVTPLGLQLFFGGASIDTSADVSFTNGGVSAFGAVLSSVGDVNGDGIADFAASARALGGNAGTVYLFFGKATNTWPASINVTTGGCGADVCLVGSAGGAFFGWDITGTNFDGSGPSDLVISARVANGGTGAVYVILGGSQLNVPAGTSISVPAGNPNGFVITPPASRSNFGVAIAAVGAGADGRGDLAIGANGAGTGNPAGLFYLQGEAYPAGSSGLIAPSATPMLEVAVGSTGDFGAPVRAIGDFDGDGLGDLALGRSFSAGTGLGAAQLFRRNGAIFTAGLGFFFDFAATGVDNDYATYIATGLHPLLGNIGDLDGDGRAELALGSLQGTTGGSVALFYGDQTITGRLRSNADFTLTASTTSLMVPNFVGDFDGDGFDDLAVVDGGAGADQLLLLH